MSEGREFTEKVGKLETKGHKKKEAGGRRSKQRSFHAAILGPSKVRSADQDSESDSAAATGVEERGRSQPQPEQIVGEQSAIIES